MARACPECRTAIPRRAEFCPRCGMRVLRGSYANAIAFAVAGAVALMLIFKWIFLPRV